MKKFNATIIIITFLAIFITGCSTKDEPTSTTEESGTMSGKQDEEDINDADSKEQPEQEADIIRISDQELSIDAKNFTEDDFSITNESPEQIIFPNVILPDDFTIEDVVIKKHGGIDWNYSSYVCSFQLLIGNKKQALFSFGNDYASEDDESILINSKYSLQSGYLGWDDHIVLLSYDKELGEICFDCTDYFNKSMIDYKFKNYSDASNFKLISAGITSFYLIYDKEDKKFIDTYSYGKDGITFVKKQRFKDDVVDMYTSDNTIFVEYKNEDNRYVAICNKSFALLDVIQLDIKTEIDSIKYILERNEKCELKLYAKKDDKLYEADISIDNNYPQLYSYTVLINQDPSYNKKYEHHYIINEGYWIFDNGKIVEEEKLLDGNYNGTNYFLLKNGDIVKSNSEYDVCYILEKPYNGVTRFMNIDDYYVGLNGSDEICYIDEEYKSRVVDNNFLGEKMSFDNIIFDSVNENITYINAEEKAIYTINKEGKRKLDTIIPDEIWEAAYEEQYNNYLKMGYDEKGIGIIGYQILYYYDRTDKEWNTIKTEQEIRYNPDNGYTYSDVDSSYILDTDKHIFKPYYINKSEIYNNMVVDDMLYVNIYSEYVEEDVMEDTNHKVLDSEYVPLETPSGNYRLSDYKMADNHKVFKEYETNSLYSLEKDKWNKIISEPVRLYSITDKGVLYTGFEDRAYLYYYDFNSGSTITLYDDSYVSDLELIGDHGYFRPVDEDVLNRINLENKMTESLKVENSRLHFEASNSYIAIDEKGNNNINIIDLNKFEIIDTIEGSDFKWSDDYLFYDCSGYLVKYDPSRKESIIMANITYPYILAIHKDNIYFLICYDGPAPLEIMSVDKIYELDKSDTEVDYYLLYNGTDYGAHLLIYDNNKKRLKALEDAETVTYEVNENVIRYKGDSYETKGKWQEIIVEEGANVKVIVPQY
ncbi:hypothetical protein [Vallitalea guaymasensis]|uniref:Uncharacterized protein n=1 Tax=Vallitalea guaymasensis TaxID=1185412 RepID=A0A8J8M9D8_9FIRM|nr:hypothetical protein [Vallitalea guaymasensis]QUH28744.1 hypothetical protein HYG85_07395 [Vallitalea guaymasensis]